MRRPKGVSPPNPLRETGAYTTPGWTCQPLAHRLGFHPQETQRPHLVVVFLVLTKKEVMYLLGSAVLSILHSEKIAKEQRRKKR